MKILKLCKDIFKKKDISYDTYDLSLQSTISQDSLQGVRSEFSKRMGKYFQIDSSLLVKGKMFYRELFSTLILPNAAFQAGIDSRNTYQFRTSFSLGPTITKYQSIVTSGYDTYKQIDSVLYSKMGNVSFKLISPTIALSNIVYIVNYWNEIDINNIRKTEIWNRPGKEYNFEGLKSGKYDSLKKTLLNTVRWKKCKNTSSEKNLPLISSKYPKTGIVGLGVEAVGSNNTLGIGLRAKVSRGANTYTMCLEQFTNVTAGIYRKISEFMEMGVELKKTHSKTSFNTGVRFSSLKSSIKITCNESFDISYVWGRRITEDVRISIIGDYTNNELNYGIELSYNS